MIAGIDYGQTKNTYVRDFYQRMMIPAGEYINDNHDEPKEILVGSLGYFANVTHMHNVHDELGLVTPEIVSIRREKPDYFSVVEHFDWDIRVCKVNGYHLAPPDSCFHEHNEEVVAKIVHEPKSTFVPSRWTIFVIEK